MGDIAEAEHHFLDKLSKLSSRINDSVIWAMINNEHDKNVNDLYCHWIKLNRLIVERKGEHV